MSDSAPKLVHHKIEDFPEHLLPVVKMLEPWERFHPNSFRELVRLVYAYGEEKHTDSRLPESTDFPSR